MKNRSSLDVIRGRGAFHIAFFLLFAYVIAARAADLTAVTADRVAIERIYYTHRTGTKRPFEETMPSSLIEQLVKADAQKEAVLKKAYGVEVTPAMVDAEVQRINTTTRAPETLAEIKHALGDDPLRFARSMARPIVVERILRERFDNDDKLHAPQRQAMDALRSELLAAKKEGKPADALLLQIKESANAKSAEVSETEWLLTPRPLEEVAPAKPVQPSAATTGNAKGGAYSVEATAQVAQVLSSPEKNTPGNEEKRKSYFEELPGELQNVLRAQLRQPGDVSAVVEMPGGFTLYLAKEKTAAQLAVAVVSLRKRSYEEWLAKQPE